MKIKIQELKNQIDIGKKKTMLIGRILDDEKKRYKYGKISLDKLIETSNSFAIYRLEYQSNIVDFNKLIIRWFALSDQLIKRIEAF